ncbi:MAG: magnesium transporter, partial [Clostridia bacterium]|nr:magnesium transporter [Clostridia bacterium]
MPGTITFEKMIAQLFEERKYASVRDVFKTMNPADIAAIFAGLEEEETKSAALFRLLPKELAAESFVEMDPDLQEGLIKKLT